MNGSTGIASACTTNIPPHISTSSSTPPSPHRQPAPSSVTSSAISSMDPLPSLPGGRLGMPRGHPDYLKPARASWAHACKGPHRGTQGRHGADRESRISRQTESRDAREPSSPNLVVEKRRDPRPARRGPDENTRIVIEIKRASRPGLINHCFPMTRSSRRSASRCLALAISAESR